MRATQPVSLYNHLSLLGKGAIGARWLLTGRGIGASNHFENCGFIRSGAGIEYPDSAFHFLPIAMRYDGKSTVGGHGFQAHVGPTRSKSRGSVTLRSADPRDAPAIRFNYMSHPDDSLRKPSATSPVRRFFPDPAFRATTNSTRWFGTMRRVPITRVEPRVWVDGMIRWRWSIPNAGLLALTVCASPIARFFL